MRNDLVIRPILTFPNSTPGFLLAKSRYSHNLKYKIYETVDNKLVACLSGKSTEAEHEWNAKLTSRARLIVKYSWLTKVFYNNSRFSFHLFTLSYSFIHTINNSSQWQCTYYPICVMRRHRRCKIVARVSNSLALFTVRHALTELTLFTVRHALT